MKSEGYKKTWGKQYNQYLEFCSDRSVFIFTLWVEIERKSIQASGRRTSLRRHCRTEKRRTF